MNEPRESGIGASRRESALFQTSNDVVQESVSWSTRKTSIMQGNILKENYDAPTSGSSKERGGGGAKMVMARNRVLKT